MMISVVIPARNEEDTISSCIESVLYQDHDDVEIIVVNDGSTDNTKKIVEKFPVRLINFKNGHSAAFARNAGAKKAKGDVLYFLDADVTFPDKSYLKRLNSDFVEGDAVSITVNTPHAKSFIQKAQAAGRKRYPRHDKKLVLDFYKNPESYNEVTCLRAIKRGIFNELGGFDEKIFYFEDGDLHVRFAKRGGILVYDPRLAINHEEPASIAEIIRQARWIGRGLYTLSERGQYRLKALVLWWGFVFSGIFSVFFPPLIFVFGALCLFIVLWTIRISLVSRDPLHSMGWMAIHFFRTIIATLEFLRLKISEK
ncbi:MAG: glycosyltransferase [Candidatus Altiarchaeota archaeon]